jgi:hypothetical protein
LILVVILAIVDVVVFSAPKSNYKDSFLFLNRTVAYNFPQAKVKTAKREKVGPILRSTFTSLVKAGQKLAARQLTKRILFSKRNCGNSCYSAFEI